MTKSITSTNDVTDQIADEAIDQLAAAVEVIIQLKALFRACRRVPGLDSDAVRLAELGEYAAMDHGNGFNCGREALRERLNNCAPQLQESKNVARNSGGDQ